MKRNVFMAFIMSLFVFTACDNFPDELIVTINESGYVTVRVIDNDGNPLEGATVEIISSGVLFSGITNASGLVTSGKLLQGSYRLDVSFTAGRLTYQERMDVQVIAGETRTVEINLFANVGNVNIQLEAWDSWITLPEGLNVFLIHESVSCVFESCIEMAHFKGKVDSRNRISFENIPVGWYQILAYDDANGGIQRWRVVNNFVRIERGRTIEHAVRVEYW